MTQVEKILDYMERHGSITDAEAYQHLGIRRLSARIFDLRASGLNISTEGEKGKNRFGEPTRYARYRLEKENA